MDQKRLNNKLMKHYSNDVTESMSKSLTPNTNFKNQQHTPKQFKAQNYNQKPLTTETDLF